MARSNPLDLSSDHRVILDSWLRAGKTEQRLTVRAKIILAAAEGATHSAISSQFGVSVLTVAKWKERFRAGGPDALQDSARSGKPRTYDETTERRILEKLDEPPPKGYSCWNGTLLRSEERRVGKECRL